MATCPYNRSHRFIAEKLDFHVMRCKDGKKMRLQFSHCPYNTKHIVRNEELRPHLESCPNRRQAEELEKMFEGSRGMESDMRLTFDDDNRSRNRSRSRSRDRLKKQEDSTSSTTNIGERISKVDISQHVEAVQEECDETLFDDCDQCRRLMADYIGACGYDIKSPIIVLLKTIIKLDDK